MSSWHRNITTTRIKIEDEEKKKIEVTMSNCGIKKAQGE